MNVITLMRLLLNSILVFFFGPRLIHSVSSLSILDEKVDQPQTSHEKHPVKRILRDPFTNTADITGLKQHWSLPAVWIPEQPGRTPARVPPESNRLPGVSATCSKTGLVLRVKKNFYGFSAEAEELTLGQTCKSNGVIEPKDELLFTYALTDCQSEQQVLPDYIVYKFVLHYVPLSHLQPFRSRVNVRVECRFKRHHHVDRLVVRPTWQTLLHKNIRSRSGDFRIQLMDDSWSSPVRSAVYLLGQKVNVQVSSRHHYLGVRLFINRCYVTTINTLSKTKYSIIDNYGCLQESRKNPGASRFRFSKADNVVQFSFAAFQFIEAPDARVTLHCELSVSGGGPSPVQKSCFYSHTHNRWISVFGQDSVCDCCDSVCNQTKTKQIIYEGFVNSDQAGFPNPSPLSTLASSTLDSSLLTFQNDDVNWFEDRLAKEPQRSLTHKNFITSVTPAPSEGHAKRRHESHTSTVLREKERKAKEVEKQEDVEILMANSESFVGSEKPEVNARFKAKEKGQELEQFEGLKNHRTEVASLGWSGDRVMQNKISGQSNWPMNVQGVGEGPQKGEVFMKTSIIVNETMDESSNINESALGDGKLQDMLLSSISEEEEKEYDFSGNGEEVLDVLPLSEFEDKTEFPVRSDELMEQGVVRRLDLRKYYIIPEEM
ncbi:uncharacterized protein si:ch211-67f13.7 [Myxocyprinus asiaticus]|uniref:uncharacterized protein si:ch211-67f13.7 n=1 Tax=Myxocyprinus asiaticus TaxID=70543 RepID=UPI00222295CF|nr:uncharacterized protein si:ch211-67f13.7 [Myxocyprinus asiaticus]